MISAGPGCEAGIGMDYSRGPRALLCLEHPTKYYRGKLPFPIALCEKHASYFAEEGMIDARPVEN